MHKIVWHSTAHHEGLNEYIFYFIDFFVHIHCIIAACQNFLPKASKHSVYHIIYIIRNLQKVHSAYLKVEDFSQLGCCLHLKTPLSFLLNIKKNFNSTWWLTLYSSHYQTSLYLSIWSPSSLTFAMLSSPCV